MKYNITLILVLTLISFSCTDKENKEVASVNSQDKAFKIDYEKFTLDNGLDVILHVDKSNPIVAVATIMHVGSNREKPGKTGFAHFFEHMSFNDSENVPVGANRKMIPEWGGSRNGGTSNDYTIYYEVVPKDAFEKILWIDSDRFGYMINTVTKEALEREKQVVKNEKRQRVDNAAYGYTQEIIRKNLYPENHPYNWTVIGALPDLQAATIDDVKEFYNDYYGAANASLVISGDIDVAETKQLVEKWFGEIPSGPKVETPQPQPVKLDSIKSLYFEDDFAKLPELHLIFPTVEQHHKDSYALGVLGRLLSGSKSAPLYKSVVKEAKLAPRVRAYQRSSEIAGEFIFRIRANAKTDLDSVKLALDKGLKAFEKNGVNETHLTRIKAELETQLYAGVTTVLNKAFTLVQDNEFTGDPSYITQTAKFTKAVTAEDVMRVYRKYIKNKNYVMTSVVPKNQLDLAITNATEADVWKEEVKQNVASEEVSQGAEAVYEKTPSKYDRSEPDFGELPLIKSPEVWKGELQNGMLVLGTEINEVPLVEFDITIPGGQLLEVINKTGVSSLLSRLLMQGTATKTPEELEEAIGLLGASINMYSSKEDFHITGRSLVKNFDETIKLVKEIILEPRWDKAEFERLLLAQKTSLKGREANPNFIASSNFNKLIYGEKHPFGMPLSGTIETVNNITLDDLKNYYKKLSPENAYFHVAGDLSKEKILTTIADLNAWKGDKIAIPSYTIPEQNITNTLYFIDVPNAKQSVLYIGKLALSEKNEEALKLKYANEILGAGSSGRLFQTLRISKGYTYGAYSSLQTNKEISPFVVRTSVRANATQKSLSIIKDMVTNYAENFGKAEVDLTKNKILKGQARAYEGLGNKLGLLKRMSKYNKADGFLEQDQNTLVNMTVEDYKETIKKHLVEKDMIYVVVGDKATQFKEVKALGKKVVELDINGNKI